MSPPFTSGLNGLVNLTRLNLSYNQINDVTGELNTDWKEFAFSKLKWKHYQVIGMSMLLIPDVLN